MSGRIAEVIDYGPTWVLTICALVAFVVWQYERAGYGRRNARTSDRLRGRR